MGQTIRGSQTAALSAQKSVQVTNSAGVILAANPARRGFLIANDGSTKAYLGAVTVTEGSAASATGGLPLAAGQALGSDQMDGFTGAIYGVTASGTTVVGVWEW